MASLIEMNPEIQQDLDDAMEVWELLGSDDVSFSPRQVFAWQNIEAQVEFDETESLPRLDSSTSRKRTQVWMAVAAGIALLITALFVFLPGDEAPITQEISEVQPLPSNEDEEVVFSALNESITFYLPDSSLVQLSKNSQLTIKEDFASGERVTYLEGEAFFDIAHDEEHPFVILTQHTKTKVLGTSFNIRAYPEEPKKVVRVESGVVMFTSTDQGVDDSLYLYKSDQGVYDLNISSLVKEPGKSLRLLGERSTKKVDVKEQEARFPARFLIPEFDLKSKVIAPSVVKVEVVNEARYTSYRDLLITIKYSSNRGEREANFNMKGEVAPGKFLKGRFKLRDWFKRSKVLDVTIRNAEGFQNK